jgi:tripartite-type tricarboxylate transporter receptor subunit TctC
LAAPNGTPDDIVASLRGAFQNMLKDEEFIAEAQKSQLRLLARSGEELETSILAAFNTSSPDIIRRARELTQ